MGVLGATLECPKAQCTFAFGSLSTSRSIQPAFTSLATTAFQICLGSTEADSELEQDQKTHTSTHSECRNTRRGQLTWMGSRG